MENEEVLLQAEKEYQKQYRLSSWWIEHRDGLRRLGLVAFACVDAVVLLVAGWALVDGFVVSEPAETRAVLELAAYGQDDLHAYAEANKAKDLDVGGAVAVASSEGKFDLYATVANPNDDWWGEFTYAFESSAGTTEPASGFVLPGSEKPLVAFAVPSTATPRSVRLSVTNLVWHHVDRHVTGDVSDWVADRVNFLVDAPAFQPVDVDGKLVPRVTFTVTNGSAFSYYEPMFVVRLLRGNTLVGVTSTTLSSLDAGESKDVSLNWFGTVPSANKTEVVADVNPFDIDVYKPLEGETTEDTRTRVLPRGRR